MSADLMSRLNPFAEKSEDLSLGNVIRNFQTEHAKRREKYKSSTALMTHRHISVLTNASPDQARASLAGFSISTRVRTQRVIKPAARPLVSTVKEIIEESSEEVE